MTQNISRRVAGFAAASTALAVAGSTLLSSPALAQQKPIKIGFSMSLTGPLGAGGKSRADRHGDLAR